MKVGKANEPGMCGMTKTSRRPSALVVLGAVAAIVLAGCGGSKSPSVASITTPPPTTATATSSGAAGSTSAGGGAVGSGSAPAQAEPGQAALEYARCMRANGVPDFPDPSAGGGFLFSPSTGVDPSSPAFEAAQATCERFMPSGLTPGSTTHPSAQWLAHMVKVAGCMRRHGISDFPDPTTTIPTHPLGAGSGPGVISDIEGVILVFPASIDEQSPLFTRAAAACGFPLHDH